MKVVFMGTPDFAVPSLEALAKEGFDILGVITQPDRPKGRGQKLQPSPVKEKAVELGLNVYQPNKIRETEFVNFLQGLELDFIVVVAFGQILPKEILNIPKYGCINVHASLLPKFRGAAPIHWAVIKGEKETGVTTMFMDEGLDTGDMLLKECISITSQMTTGEVHDKLAQLGGQLLIKTLNKLQKGQITPEPQNEKEASYAPLLKKEHEKISWYNTREDIHNLIRGMNSWPGAYTFYKGLRLKIWQSSLENVKWDSIAQPGTILAQDNQGFWVQTIDGPLLITQVQPAGRKIMSAKDFFNGYQVELGQVLGDKDATK
ncbi:MAG: methionyl-tRNA formyltransferase [Clostridia bacterium]|nr:methionyl-tRNA formyltransferase [Clostridia bacterium]